MRRLLFFVLLYSFCFTVQAQPSFKIEGCLTDLPFQKVLLSTLDGYATVIDTAIVKNGCFEFNLSSEIPPGMYSLILDKKTNAFIHIVYNREDIKFKSNFKHLSDSMVFTKSVDNQLFYRNVKFQTTYSRKIDLLNRINALYDANSGFAKQILAEKLALKKDYNKHIDLILNEGRNTLYSKMLKAQQAIDIPANLSNDDQLKYAQLHALDNIDFGCEALINTDIVQRFLPEYINLFKVKSATRYQQELYFIEGVDRILQKSASNEKMYKFICQNLEMIFQYGEYDFISLYIKEKRASSGMCMTDDETTELKASIEDIKRMAVGQTAPNMQITDIVGKTLQLTDIKMPYTLLVFWSSRCGHCVNMIPELNTIYLLQKTKKLEVLAISTDPIKEEWLTFLKSGNYKWINFLLTNDTFSKTMHDYNITGTPTFIILDEQKKIISKPFTLDEVKDKFVELKII